MFLTIHYHKTPFQSIAIFQGGIIGLGENSTDGMTFSMQSYTTLATVLTWPVAVTALLCFRCTSSRGVEAGLSSSRVPVQLDAHLLVTDGDDEEPTE